MATTYRITHRTAYRYSAQVAPSYSLMHLLPRDTPRQRCRDSAITVDPTPDDQSEHVDFFGNRVAYVAVASPHRALTVTATSLVEVDGDGGASSLSLFGQQTWEDVRDHRDVDAVAFTLDSRRIESDPRFADYAAPSFPAGRQLVEAVTDLSSRIHADFAFAPGETKVDTPLTHVLDSRQGVCQDFAHLGIACLRSLGLPARYVSGYLETNPPPGRRRLAGADVSHAWFSVRFPDGSWLDLDPTNDQVVGDRHIVTAYGRDYSDIAPLTGVMFTRGRTTSLQVEVDVVAAGVS